MNPLPADVTASLQKSPPGLSPSLWHQAIRLGLFVVWFTTSCVTIVATQLIGSPLALYDKNIFYAYSTARDYYSSKVYFEYKEEFRSYGNYNNAVVWPLCRVEVNM